MAQTQTQTQSQTESDKRWAMLKTGSKKAWDLGWDAAGKYLGEPSNRLIGQWGIEGFWPTTSEKEFDKAARILRVFTQDSGVASTERLNEPDPSAHKKQQRLLMNIPPSAIAGAKAIAIFTVFRTGLHWSAASGSGIVLSRLPDGSWSAPSGILIHTLGIGFMIGIDIYDVVLVLNTDEAVQQFTSPHVKLGGEVTVAAGPVGEGRQKDISKSASWSYVKSKGFYAGAQIDGTVIIERNDENERYYGRKVKVAELFDGTVPPPAHAQGLYEALAAAEGRAQAFDKVPDLAARSEKRSESEKEALNGSQKTPESSSEALPRQMTDDVWEKLPSEEKGEELPSDGKTASQGQTALPTSYYAQDLEKVVELEAPPTPPSAGELRTVRFL